MAKNRTLFVNDAGGKLPSRVLIQCSTLVARDAVTRRTVNGQEEIVISSFTLPDDIVMNGGLYPAEEIDKSFMSLERTLAPVEHPTDAAGQFISANDPTSIHNFYAGAFNENVHKEGGRIAIDKVINVAEARRTDRGKRLLDRVEELENNSDPRPVHTSVGVFLDVEPLEAPQTNTQGQEYTWVARNMVFDHDAILLDSNGAAQPHQGVGMAVNTTGEEFEVQTSLVTIDAEPVEAMSHNEIREALQRAITQTPINGDWVVDVFDGNVIYEADEVLFQVQYIMDGRTAKITGMPLPVSRNVQYVPKTNNAEGDTMRELMLKALAAAGISVNSGISDEELMAKYNELQANTNSDGDGNGDGEGNGEGAQSDADGVAEVVANAIKPLVEKVEGLEAKLNEQDDEELAKVATVVVNSGKYTGLTLEGAKKLGLDELKSMAANCQTSFGLNVHHADGSEGDKSHSYSMPE